jgi:hypothetical protein
MEFSVQDRPENTRQVKIKVKSVLIIFIDIKGFAHKEFVLEGQTTGCGRNNSHISKNHCGVTKADSGVWSVLLGRIHNNVFSRRHAVVGCASRLCGGGFLKNFHLSGTVNKQNFRYWAAENPPELHVRPLHSAKVTVWCTLSSIGVIESYFLKRVESQLL